MCTFCRSSSSSSSLVAKSCPTLATPWTARLLCPWNSPGQNTGVGSCSFHRASSQPGIEPRSHALQVDLLLSEPPGKPRKTGVGSLSLLQGIFPTQGLNWGLQHCRWIPYQLSYEGSPKDCSPENKLVLFLPLVRYNSRI